MEEKARFFPADELKGGYNSPHKDRDSCFYPEMLLTFLNVKVKMRLIFIFFFLWLLSCGDSGDQKSSELKGSVKTPRLDRQRDQARNQQGEKEPQALNENQKKVDPSHKFNQLKAEETHLQQKRGGDFAFSDYDEGDPICRRFAGCMKFCAWSGQDKKCHQWPVSAVIAVWLNLMRNFSEKEFLNVAEKMVQDKDIAFFLKDSDRDNQVIKKVIAGLSEAQCPLIESGDVYYTSSVPPEVPASSLFISHPEGPEKGVKKIISTEFYKFDLPVFKGFMNRCLDDKKSYLIEQMAEHQNWRGFEMAHTALVSACGQQTSCVRLAYCKLGSKKVLEEIKALDKYNTGIQFEGLECTYSDFHSLPL